MLTNITAQMVVSAKFHGDKISLYRMIILMTDVVKDKHVDLITCINNRDSPFHLAKALAMGIALRKKIPFKDVLSDHNQKAISEIGNKSILIVDDVIYKGTSMK